MVAAAGNLDRHMRIRDGHGSSPGCNHFPQGPGKTARQRRSHFGSLGACTSKVRGQRQDQRGNKNGSILCCISKHIYYPRGTPCPQVEHSTIASLSAITIALLSSRNNYHCCALLKVKYRS